MEFIGRHAAEKAETNYFCKFIGMDFAFDGGIRCAALSRLLFEVTRIFP
jgi:hypothetical protein